jgi:hypothetical protein
MLDRPICESARTVPCPAILRRLSLPKRSSASFRACRGSWTDGLSANSGSSGTPESTEHPQRVRVIAVARPTVADPGTFEGRGKGSLRGVAFVTVVETAQVGDRHDVAFG